MASSAWIRGVQLSDGAAAAAAAAAGYDNDWEDNDAGGIRSAGDE